MESHSKGQLPLNLISDVFFLICPLHFTFSPHFPTSFLDFSILLFFPCYFLFHKEKHRSSTGLDYEDGLELNGERTTFTIREQTVGKPRNAKRITKWFDDVVKTTLTQL